MGADCNYSGTWIDERRHLTLEQEPERLSRRCPISAASGYIAVNSTEIRCTHHRTKTADTF